MYTQDIKTLATNLNNIVSMCYRKETNDRIIIEAVMVGDEYRARTFSYKDGDIFIDLGSHIGTWTVLMAMKNPTFTVYSFEPIPENFELLKKNIELNHLLNVKPFNLAISSESGGTEEIYYTDDTTPFGAEHKFVGSMFGGTHSIKVQKISLNEVLNGIPKCRVLKADCEGCIEKAIAFVTPENLQKIDYIVGEYHSVNNVPVDVFYKVLEPYFLDMSQLVRREGELTRFFYVNRRL